MLLPDDIGVLARVFPVLRRVNVIERAASVRASALDESQARRRAFGALRTLLARIAALAPVVWFIDDLQWGDADSAEALFEALRPPDAPGVLLLGTYRSDEAGGSPFLSAWAGWQRDAGAQFEGARSGSIRSLSTNAPS